MNSPAFGAVSVPQAQIFRPKVKVTFDRANFEVSYGKTLDLCMKIVPRTRFKSLITFDSSPVGVIEGKFGGTATCPDSSYDQIQISANVAKCEASASLLVKVHGKTVSGGTLPGTVMLPNKVTAVLAENNGCPGGYGASKIYYVYFKSNVEGATPNFNGLNAHENLSFPSNGCNLATGIEFDWIIGDPPVPTNAIDDANSKCFDVPATCTSIVNQTFTVGSCITSPATTITFNFVNGLGDITRSDEGGQ